MERTYGDRNAFSYTSPTGGELRPAEPGLFFSSTALGILKLILLDLLYNYQSNLAQYDRWQEYFRTRQPRMLILWGKNDPFFTVEGAKAYQRDIPKAELGLIDSGHFALEDFGSLIAEPMREFLGQSAAPSGASAA